jgi:CRISPR system Cascade subunit CasB
MTTPAPEFIRYLQQLADDDRGAMAVLRRSAGFEPGAYPPAFPYVERHVAHDSHAEDSRRRARYLVAMLFALHPCQETGSSVAAAFGHLLRKRGSDSIEKRFIALLAADPEQLPVHLRQAVSLLKAGDFGCDYALLEADLIQWLNPFDVDRRDRVRQRWARDFYRVLGAAEQQTDATFAPTK